MCKIYNLNDYRDIHDAPLGGALFKSSNAYSQLEIHVSENDVEFTVLNEDGEAVTHISNKQGLEMLRDAIDRLLNG